ncbi:MAG: DNA primase [Myxococcota bacterium]
MGRIPDEIIEKVRDHTDLVELVGRNVSLKRAGRSYTGLCPFHDEKTPSFNVNPERRSFYCFGCQEGGDLFAFVMKTESLTFAEAVRSLAREAGIEIPVTAGGESASLEPLYAANAKLAERYAEMLGASQGTPGSEYLEGRGLGDEVRTEFGIGFAPDRWDFAVTALREAQIGAEVGERAGLLAPRKSGGHYDLLRGRVIFPIQDVRGRVVGFGGRAVSEGQEPKYLNTPESPVFRKRESFYGFPHALESIRRRDRAVVVEGYFDRIALHQAGVEEALATCGTALTREHAKNLRRRTRNVVLLFDGDAAGLRAVTRALEALLPEGLRVQMVHLPAGDDPDSFLQREGGKALRELVDSAEPALDFAMRQTMSEGCETPWQKADAVAEIAPLLARLPSSVERGDYCRQLALYAGTEARHVEEAVRAASRGKDARDAVPVQARQNGPEERNLAQLVRAMIEHPSLAEQLEISEFRQLVTQGPLTELALAVVTAAQDGPLLPASLADDLSPEARAYLHEFAVQEQTSELENASQTLHDTLNWLRKHRRRAQQRELTARLRDPGVDAVSVLREKQELVSKPASTSSPPSRLIL